MLRITETLRASPIGDCGNSEEVHSFGSSVLPTTTGQLTLFTEDFPVRTSASQGNRRDLKEPDQDSGLKCCESSQSADPLSSLLKTFVERSISPSIPCKPEWRQKTTRSGRSSFLQLHLAHPTKGKDCSSSESGGMWPTARAIDCNGASRKRVLNAEGKAEGPWQLREAVLASGPRLPALSEAGSTLTPEEAGG